MKRRDFLRGLAAGGLTAATFLYGDPWSRCRPAVRAAARGKTLVVIFQRGGCDGLNVVVPYGDSEYYNLRPTIAIPAPGSGGEVRPALDLDGFFGFHPSLAPLHGIFQQGRLAVLPAVHYPDGNRSHFDSEIIIESGARSKLYDGWLSRYLVGNPGAAIPLRAVGFGNEMPHSLRGEASVATFNDLGDFAFGGDDHAHLFRDRLRRVYAQEPASGQVNRRLLHAQGNILFDNLDFLESLDPDGYEPENGAEYPNSAYGRQLKQAAMLIKDGVGLEVAALNIGGWDTHSNQGGAQEGGYQSRRLQEFAAGIGAFYTDLGSLIDDVVLLTMTEFGRTARENGSRGTDHGNAGAWFVLGGRVRGGIYGEWPGLAPENLYRGRYLAQSLDFRDVMAEVVARHLGGPDLVRVF
ncbi:MAG: DUF1501 domain-containing protein, partial [Deltaproteobacteria bacterium]|nr:DUF1501 domain-containing protein [Deltaproteobacteria bacterium]